MTTKREAQRTRGFYGVALWSPKHYDNVGTVLRSANIWGAAFVEFIKARFYKQRSDTFKTWRHLPIVECGDLLIPYSCIPVAVELVDGAKELSTYKHPERALYVFGPEDGSLPKDVIAQCRDVVKMDGKFCANLAVAASLVLYHRHAQRTGIRP